jgi:uncharacterized protein (DUF2345 family)
MISAVSAVSVGIISASSLTYSAQRKVDLVAIGEWALAAGHSALVSAVTLAIKREGLASA